ncbi:hypothetical protein RJ639_000781 [Escallonia herrerae]|uniref:Pentatricopeptide repeat-containing protein n=1 Tax=Escallonia herrerae TaxID=1293975 RepID=A0AA88XA76_9ASTE|nr:hypothetical protein RJ639_000781 [Escallonia herrerae]
MLLLLKPRWKSSLVQTMGVHRKRHLLFSLYSTMLSTGSLPDLQELCRVVSHGTGSLDDMEASLNQFKVPFTSPLVSEVIDSCRNDAPTRRLLRFFLWSRKSLDFDVEDEDFNCAIRVFAEKKDFTALDILISDLGKECRAMETSTFSVVAKTLVKLGREEEALGIFKNLEKLKCPQDNVTVTAIVSALCEKGHAKKAEGVVWHHKDKISGVERCIYRSLLYGWSVQENVKAARRIIKEMKSAGVMPDHLCYTTLLRCICKRNLKANPSGLVPEAFNVMMEMRTYGILPTSIDYNILLSCLVRTRRVKESLRILDTMRKAGCSSDWVSYYLVARVLYLTGRFGKGKQIVDKMIEEGLVPERKFFYDLIGVLCGVERVKYALELFELMKKSSLGNYGPVYDLLIPKLCRGGDFAKGRELWNEATSLGVTLQCSVDVLDPTITEVFKPVRKVEEKCSIGDCSTPKTRARTKKTRGKQYHCKKKKQHKKRKKKAA